MSKVNIICVYCTEAAVMYSFQTIITFLIYQQYLLVEPTIQVKSIFTTSGLIGKAMALTIHLGTINCS